MGSSLSLVVQQQLQYHDGSSNNNNNDNDIPYQILSIIKSNHTSGVQHPIRKQRRPQQQYHYYPLCFYTKFCKQQRQHQSHSRRQRRRRHRIRSNSLQSAIAMMMMIQIIVLTIQWYYPNDVQQQYYTIILILPPMVHGWKIRNFFHRQQNDETTTTADNNNNNNHHYHHHEGRNKRHSTNSRRYVNANDADSDNISHTTSIETNTNTGIDDDIEIQQKDDDMIRTLVGTDDDITTTTVNKVFDTTTEQPNKWEVPSWMNIFQFNTETTAITTSNSNNNKDHQHPNQEFVLDFTTSSSSSSPTLAPTKILLSSSSSSDTTWSQEQQPPPPLLLLDRMNMICQVIRIPLQQFYDLLQQQYQITKDQIQTILFYRPPVGLVSILVIVRILHRTKQFLYHTTTAAAASIMNENNIEDQLFIQKIQQQQKKQHIEKRYQRAYYFNHDDVAYHYYGGVERIRTRLCLAGLYGIAQQLEREEEEDEQQQPHDMVTETVTTNFNTSSASMNDTVKSNSNTSFPKKPKKTQNDVKQHQQLQLLIKALSVSCTPKMSWIQYIYEMIIPLAQIEECDTTTSSSSRSASNIDNNNNKDLAATKTKISIENMNRIATVTGQVRLHDALLRLCRDRVLQTTYRLARTVEHWERRLKYSTRRSSMSGNRGINTSFSNVNVFLQKLFRIHSIDNDRLCLSLAKAAYTLEVTRLGEITALLMERPYEMDESNLIYALKDTEQRQLQPTINVPATVIPSASTTTPDGEVNFHEVSSSDKIQTDQSSSYAERRQQSLRHLISKVYTAIPSSVRHLSKYSFRWKADGKGLISIRKFDNTSDGYIDGESAYNVLIDGKHRKTPSNNDDRTTDWSYVSQSSSNDIWMSQANDWIRRVKVQICQVIQDSLQASTAKSLPTDFSTEHFEAVQAEWCRINGDNKNVNINREQQYRTIVNYVDSSTSWRRIGEGEKIRLRDVFGMRDWITRLDILGIPSSIFYVYVAYQVHTRIIVPYWAIVRKHVIEISEKSLEILQQRVWVPLKGIYDDIMNRSPSMMSALGLDIEEASLDHMLRDLNFGDGTPATRQEAIRKATEQYEHDLSHGLFANFARGRLIRLLLIQVQQLKVGMLSALETIDVLMVGNRIHFKVLAAIPAIVIASFGTRYFIRGLYNIRAKDIRPISAVHHEMTQYLNKIEKILLLSDTSAVLKRNWSERQNSKDSRALPRTPNKDVVSSLQTTAASSRIDKTTYSNDDRIFSGRTTISLTPYELGEMILNTHRYLILLDFSSPQPFPTNQCDEIHASLQQYYNKVIDKSVLDTFDGGDANDANSRNSLLDPTRQIQWLHTIQLKHQELMKFL